MTKGILRGKQEFPRAFFSNDSHQFSPAITEGKGKVCFSLDHKNLTTVRYTIRLWVIFFSSFCFLKNSVITSHLPSSLSRCNDSSRTPKHPWRVFSSAGFNPVSSFCLVNILSLPSWHISLYDLLIVPKFWISSVYLDKSVWTLLNAGPTSDKTGAGRLHHGFISVSKQWRNPDTTWAIVVSERESVLLTFSTVIASASHNGALSLNSSS